MNIRHPKDFLTGLLFIAVGAAAMALSTGLVIGTAARMGPGYFPFALGALLALLGGGLLIRSLAGTAEKGAWPRLQLKPVAVVLMSVVVFSQILRPLGLLLSTAVLVLLASTASHEFRWKEALLNAAALVAIVLAVFVFMLEFQLPVWPSFMAGRG